ncbi:hypothetical protein C8Q76DRAFT_708441 [Earliella scabrosa]|nr:hypothetical protein C8Q76DRAFT_708441 [Earliella scabrosa]
MIFYWKRQPLLIASLTTLTGSLIEHPAYATSHGRCAKGTRPTNRLRWNIRVYCKPQMSQYHPRSPRATAIPYSRRNGIPPTPPSWSPVRLQPVSKSLARAAFVSPS